ncbi:MAG: sulfur carrier protein ThiS [Candidatus Omnitrophota bacterium]|nr:sulfur carrier protein ThiS [Candidatus Omnitrophota bacterium]
MQVTVNGEPQELPEGTTVSRLLDLLKVEPERVVVEVNLTILKRGQLPSTVLNAGDQVEIVHFVGGGSKAVTGY